MEVWRDEWRSGARAGGGVTRSTRAQAHAQEVFCVALVGKDMFGGDGVRIASVSYAREFGDCLASVGPRCAKTTRNT